MVRPVQLDRVENGGPGNDIDPPSGEEPSSHAHFRGPRPPSRPPCSRPSMTSPPGGPKEGPSLTAAARGGRASLRSGRKNACGAVEQKNGIEKERSGKRLHSGRRLENEETALNRTKKQPLATWCPNVVLSGQTLLSRTARLKNEERPFPLRTKNCQQNPKNNQ